MDRRCGSGLQAVLDAAMQIRAGFSDVVIAGGADVMSAAPTTRTTDAGASRGQGCSSTTRWPGAGSPRAASTTRCPAA
ncbi:beta-ketoacyl synthase N-terminal-like domain-containing protein [Streptomyces sp. M10(2022)]